MKVAVLSFVAALVIRALRVLLRIRHVGVERIEELNRSGRGYIMAFWHSHLLMMVYARYRKPITAVISQHRDGELIARTVGYLGAKAARGSTTRGGSKVLREVIRLAGDDKVIAFTPDGPRGPRHQAQLGMVVAAQAAQVPIIPVAFVSKKKSS